METIAYLLVNKATGGLVAVFRLKDDAYDYVSEDEVEVIEVTVSDRE